MLWDKNDKKKYQMIVYLYKKTKEQTRILQLHESA